MPMLVPYRIAQEGHLKQLLVVGFGLTESLGDGFPDGLIGASITLRDPFCLLDQGLPGGCAVFREFTLSNLVTNLDSSDTCGGDSGGPVYFIAPEPRSDGTIFLHRYLVGITSRALGGVPQVFGGQCGGGGIYTAVAHPDVLEWLALQGVPLELGTAARRFAEKGFPDRGLAELQRRR